MKKIKTTIKTPLACALFAASIIGASQASTILDFRANDVASSAGTVNVTSDPLEIANPLIDNDPNQGRSSHGKGDSWGGSTLQIDGVTVGFTISEFIDYDGNSEDSVDVLVRANADGLGINSFNGGDAAAGNNGEWYTFDGAESMTWAASTSLQWEGFSTSGWNTDGNKAITISSTSWTDLIGVSTGAGVIYNSLAGSFEIRNIVGNVAIDGVTLEDLVGASGPTLDFTDITMANSGTQGSRIATMTFAAPVVTVPEPSSSALLGLAGLALILRRRK